jgi:alkanesulfonate monooxygenase SsuD/methylene tetrahydromethanopterin reductase-like flavin-dependent oxidoreductase (luciferase family)
MILPQRHPLYVAKEVASLDRLSKGRMMLGVGSGWLAEEFAALQLDWKKRGLMTDEAIRALRALWRDNPSSFQGKHFKFGPLRSLPKPVQAGGVPIIVGGHSPAAVRRAARLGDGFFPAVGKLHGLSWEVDVAAMERQAFEPPSSAIRGGRWRRGGSLTPLMLDTPRSRSAK